MSLTSLLTYDNDIKALFATIPNMKACFYSAEGEEPFPAKLMPIAPREESTARLIGQGYDYLLRAFIQRVNNKHQEQAVDDLDAYNGLNRWSGTDDNLRSRFDEVVQHRNEYILGQRDIDHTLLQDSMVLAHLDSYYRSGYMDERGPLYVNEEDITDLKHLIAATQERSSLFIAEHEIICSPSFGRAITSLVGGADGDLILDNMLLDFKTESSFKYAVRHLRQLIGYWVLSCLTADYSTPIQRLGIWNPRYCRMVSISVEDVCQSMDVIAFTDRFIDVLSIPLKSQNVYLSSVRKQHIEEVRSLWESPDQPIRQLYAAL
ncbi:hypothetical protein [Paenibacillus sp. NPDC057934]|uniref:hypothetical protein n=1 Tax=Paenibacillus sp. NPDC057934 TaxID=3346282 RepID=UPI0036D762EE